ncbi:MAG: hypothetical protein AAFO95_13365 [Cyanobacteria bacterium J06600_6]
MQMLKKLLSPEKKYYLELDEAKESEAVQTVAKAAEKTTEAVKEKAQEVVQSEPVQSVVKTAGAAIDTAQEKVASAKAELAPAKKNGKAPSPEAQEQLAKPAKSTPQNAGASSFDPPFWVAAMNNTNNKTTDSNGVVEGETFAENNLMPVLTKYRRRPGGSLNRFKDMAKSAKTPKR